MIDAEAQIRRLPSTATVKGMFLEYGFDYAKDKKSRQELSKEAAIADKRYTSFRDYPMADWLRLIPVAATAVHPELPEADALRRLGHGVYPMFTSSMIGKVVFGVLGKDPDRIFPMGYKGWQLSVNFGEITGRLLRPRTVVYEFKGVPLYLDTYNLGVLEGAIEVIGAKASVSVSMKDVDHAEYEICWQ